MTVSLIKTPDLDCEGQFANDETDQGACYDAVTNDPVYGPGEGCPITEFAQLGFCSWPNGGSCTTPSCNLGLGQHAQCNGARAADGQYGK
jgi:hypothetical protein